MSISKFFSLLSLILLTGLHWLQAAERQDSLRPALEKTYQNWRSSVIGSNYEVWRAETAAYRQMKVRNQAVSERRAFPASVFENAVTPPSLANLKLVGILVSGNSAAATYFGKIDFGLGAAPDQNALTVLFVRERDAWKYDTARFFNLGNMKELRQKLAAGDPLALNEEGFQPLSYVPAMAAPCPAPMFIAKVFVDCPGRRVKINVNGISDHEFSDTRNAEVIWGGAKMGQNAIRWTVEDDNTAEEKGPLRIAVYLMPEIEGNVPVKAYEVIAAAGDSPKPVTTTFTVDEALLKMGRRGKK